MAEVYLYDASDDDYDSAGLCGPLPALSCMHTETAGGDSTLEIECALDQRGKWSYVREGRILKAWVPVRTTPQISGGMVVTTVERYSVNATATKPQRYMYSKVAGGKKLKLLPAGLSVTVVEKPVGRDRYKVKTSRYGTGWIASDAVTLVIEETLPQGANGIEIAEPSWSIRPQLFQIYKATRSGNGVVANARHITYQLAKNLTSFRSAGVTSLQTALDGILNNCRLDHDFRAYTDMADTRTGLDWRMINPIKAFLDAEDGVMARWNCQLVRDNYEFFFLRSVGMDRGIRIESGKNLIGVTYEASLENTATRILPVGKTKSGADLYMDSVYLDSPRINDYGRPLLYLLQCDDCTVGTNDVTTSIAKARMREQAQALLDNGCDMPNVTLSVDFLNLGDGEAYSQFRQMDRVYLYDIVTIHDADLGIDAKAVVTRIEWDCIGERYEHVELGNAAASLSNTSIATWQIPSGVSGSKLRADTVGSSQLADQAVSFRHVQADSIGASAIQAGSVTAEKIAVGAVDAQAISALEARLQTIIAGSLTTDALYAGLADVMRLAVGSITAGTISTDQLAAALGDFVALYAQTAGIDYAAVRDLVSDTAIIREGIGGELLIDRLAVNDANIVAMSAGKLTAGTIDASQIDVTNLNAANITVGTINGQQIAPGAVDATRLAEGAVSGSKLALGAVAADRLNLARHILY